MKRQRENSHFQVVLDDGGRLSRRKTELLSDCAYLFQDELEVGGVLTSTVIMCAAWLLELYEMNSGEILFIKGQEHIHATAKRFGVFYPPFSIAQPYFKNAKARLIGIAATASLPSGLINSPTIFEVPVFKAPECAANAIEILKAGQNHQTVDKNPKPSLLSHNAKRLIDENYLSYPSIARIAGRLNVTHEHLSRQFKRDLGMSPSEYLRHLRVADAPLWLARGEEIIDVSYEVGYNDLSRFYKQFRKTTHTAPGKCKTILRPTQK
ncbi:AraC family transcriptional regulator [bacterium]|nr:AraC family transcriptional regulator [bacterium]